jgi:hypothetical protein
MNYQSQSQQPFAATGKAAWTPNGSANPSRYNRRVIILSEDEEHFVEILRLLPPAAVASVIKWTTQLSNLALDRAVEWSEKWTEEDLQDLQGASIANFDRWEESSA